MRGEEPGVILPNEIELPKIVIGGTWKIELQFFEDEAETIPFNLTGWTVTLNLKNFRELTSGSGLTITPATGKVVPLLTAAETTTILGKELRYWLRVAQGTEPVDYLMRGGIPLLEP
jgi:hypothetical protein